jgi:hypothetical protein
MGRRSRGRAPATGAAGRPDDHRVACEVTRALVVLRGDDPDQSRHVGERRSVDQSGDVARGAAAQVDRAPVGAHDPQALQTLARRLSGAEHLEEDVIGEQDGERGDREQREPERPERQQPDQQREDQHTLDDEIDRSGDQP